MMPARLLPMLWSDYEEAAVGALVLGPFFIAAAQLYCPGVAIGELHLAGAMSGSVYTPGAIVGEISSYGDPDPYVAVTGEDTSYLQGLLDACGAVVIPAGTHDTGPLTVPACVTSITGAGQGVTILKLLPNAGAFARVLNVNRNQSTNSAIEISELTIDMNRDNQGWLGGYDLEHQAGIFLYARETNTGYLDANIHDVTISNSAADGIYVYHRTRLTLDDFTGSNLFRGGLMITGHLSETTATDVVITGGGIDVEPNSAGESLTCNFNRITCYDFDVAIQTGGGSVTVRNLTHTGGQLYLYCPATASAIFLCEDSTFIGNFEARLAGHSTFRRCTFTALPGNTSPMLTVAWYHNSFFADMSLTIDDCTFTGPGSAAIHSYIDQPAQGNDLIVTNTDAVSSITTLVSLHHATNHPALTYSGNTLNGAPWP